ncbi:hypothetical protein [Oceanobacillus oncorhynchi]|uniref:hypothetical protein n=1 Tax=Oceanobacillus oncorhynchi TaxID=545501 RepID=UPI0034D60762
MIKEYFTQNSLGKPLVLTNCTLFLDLKHYNIDTTYLFQNQRRYKIEEFGSGIVDNKAGEIFNKGYFSYTPSSFNSQSFEFFNEIFSSNPNTVSIIGYSNNLRYYVSGVSIGKNKNKFPEGDFKCEFRFLKYELA